MKRERLEEIVERFAWLWGSILIGLFLATPLWATLVGLI